MGGSGSKWRGECKRLPAAHNFGCGPYKTAPRPQPSHDAGPRDGTVVQLRTIDPNNLMVLLDFRRKLAAGEGGQVCTGPNVAHLLATDGSDGTVGDADESGASPELDAAESEGEPLQRRCTALATSVGEWPNGESDAPDTASRSPRVVDRIKQTNLTRDSLVGFR